MHTSNGTNYGNWVPSKVIYLLWGLGAAMTLIFILSLTLWRLAWLQLVSCLLAAVTLGYAAYMQACHHCFSFRGGRLMARIHKLVLKYLLWNGKGELLDVGCGSGALTIRCAKKFPEARFVGLDYWGKTWDYAKAQCEKNAELEGVDSIEFVQGDACELPFEDERFDAVISNFVFHEVRSTRDKKALVREALRVTKKGGSFAFHDLFENKRLYGDIHELKQELQKAGVSQIFYEPHSENADGIPGFVRTPMMLKDLGILYGVK